MHGAGGDVMTCKNSPDGHHEWAFHYFGGPNCRFCEVHLELDSAEAMLNAAERLSAEDAERSADYLADHHISGLEKILKTYASRRKVE